MPTFPAYSGPALPVVLNPLNPAHYGTLLKWIFFQPSRLIHYLHKADPELYGATGLLTLLRTLGAPAYRSLYMMPLVMVSALLGVVWILFEMSGASNFETAANILGGIFVGGMLGGVAFAICFSLSFGVAEGVAEGVAFGVSFSLTYALAEACAAIFSEGVTTGMTFGVALGFAFSVTGAVSGRVGGGVVEGVVLGILGGIILGVAGGLAFGTALGAGLIIGSSRIFIQGIEWPLARKYARLTEDPFLVLEKHPVLWDALAVWPLPGTDRLLRACLAADFDRGIDLAVRIAVNPFQRGEVQRALSDYLSDHPDPVRVMYRITYSSDLDHYLMPPRTAQQFHVFPSRKMVLLGELGQVCVDGSGGVYETSQRLVWSLTRHRRRLDTSPVSRLSALLYELLREEANRNRPPELQERRAAGSLATMVQSLHDALRPLPNGEEITLSFRMISDLSERNTIASLAECHHNMAWAAVPLEAPLRPAVLEVLRALREISLDLSDEQQTINVSRQFRILNQCGDRLSHLSKKVDQETLLPERTLLKRIIAVWQSTLTAEQVKLGEASLRALVDTGRQSAERVKHTADEAGHIIPPVKNPYIIGNPVTPPLFVPHSDVFDRITEIWNAPTSAHAISIIGSPRIGVTSLLHNLDLAAAPGSILVYMDVAGAITFVESTADLLLGLADKIYAAVRRIHLKSGLPEPDPSRFSSPAAAQVQFNRFTARICDLVSGGALILALDNFESLEHAIESGSLDPEIYQFLHSIAQEPHIMLVVAGASELAGMSNERLRVFFAHTEYIPLTPLPVDDAWKLITDPSPDFAVKYESEAVDRIISETGRHPYLIQLLCRDVINHLNRELYRDRKKRDLIVTLADLEAVLQTGILEKSGLLDMAKRQEDKQVRPAS